MMMKIKRRIVMTRSIGVNESCSLDGELSFFFFGLDLFNVRF